MKMNNHTHFQTERYESLIFKSISLNFDIFSSTKSQSRETFQFMNGNESFNSKMSPKVKFFFTKLHQIKKRSTFSKITLNSIKKSQKYYANDMIMLCARYKQLSAVFSEFVTTKRSFLIQSQKSQ